VIVFMLKSLQSYSNKIPMSEVEIFNLEVTLKEIKKYLPAQAPLKDFIFQNALAAFQNLPFFKALASADEIFGYKVFLSLEEYRNLYESGVIRDDVLNKYIIEAKGLANFRQWKEKVFSTKHDHTTQPRVGQLRPIWNHKYKIDMDHHVHAALFRIVCSYLDQGVSIWRFPIWKNNFLAAVREVEQDSYTSFFFSKRAKALFLDEETTVGQLLQLLVGDSAYFKQYLFDQQFAHQGWSGMVSVIEENPSTLIDKRNINLKEFIFLELILEIDALDYALGKNWKPLASKDLHKPIDIFAPVEISDEHTVYTIWQKAYEWSYYDQVLAGLKHKHQERKEKNKATFQALFCIDDREISLRDHLERADKSCETYGTPGFFNVEFFFKPAASQVYTKLCPAPTTPKFLIKEKINRKKKAAKELHFSKQTHSLLGGLLISPWLGLWSALRLFSAIFKPSDTASTASSFKHMQEISELTIENHKGETENGLQIGYSLEEMANRVESLLKSIHLIQNFAPIIYVVGHGASSVNNPFYTTMDCGACSCKPGSVNARVFSFMANKPEVRKLLYRRGLEIPDKTQFVGALHDTTRDDIVFYDEDFLHKDNLEQHQQNKKVFLNALNLNAKERSRRFESIDSQLSPETIHKQIQKRSVSLFEPRPELDHANNSLTIIGKRALTKGLFLDRRSFLNSYDYASDPTGKILENIMKPIAPVCGGINLSYYFAKVDNQKLGAGTKLPHNVMGLIGVANGVGGDLRPGLPSQMVETHDPIRQLVIVEHSPPVLLSVLQSLATYEWYKNEWMHIMAMHPLTGELFLFKNEKFELYVPLQTYTLTAQHIIPLIEKSKSLENIPVYKLA
jgi:uncharacterized protein